MAYRFAFWNVLAHIFHTFTSEAPCLFGYNIQTWNANAWQHSPPVSLHQAHFVIVNLLVFTAPADSEELCGCKVMLP